MQNVNIEPRGMNQLLKDLKGGGTGDQFIYTYMYA